jgi:hypothetical protein
MNVKKILFAILILICVSASSYGSRSDEVLPEWNWDFYYVKFNLRGYPIYNTLLGRYDFYDIDECYCGSLLYNSIIEEWEYFGL